METKTNRNKGFSKIDKILSQKSTQLQKEAFYRYKILKQWDKVAPAFVENADSKTKAVGFKKGVLTVACLSQDMARMLRLFTEQIINALNNLLGHRLVFAVH